MPDYAKLYYKLFNKITDTIEDLKQVQIEAEELYITSCEDEEEIENNERKGVTPL